MNKPALAKLDARNYRGSIKALKIKQAKRSYEDRVKEFNKSVLTYTPKKAEAKAKERSTYSHRQLPKLKQPEYQEALAHIRLKLGERSSPKQIWFSLSRNNLKMVSENTIYRYIYRDDPKLKKYLWRRGRPRRKIPKQSWNTTKNIRSIRQRPKEVDSLLRFGDLEGDTIFGKDTKDRLLTHVDRYTGLGSISLILGHNSNSIAKQTDKDLKRVFGSKVHTITYDRGSEFSNWKRTEKKTKTKIYFADPYSSYQRGRNENFNGLVRDFFPKGTDFKKLTKKDILKVETILNNRERERHNGLTPIEMFKICALGVGA